MNRINPLATPSLSSYGVEKNNIRTSMQNRNITVQSQIEADAAMKVEISEEARLISRELQTHDEALFGQEVQEQRKSDFANKLMQSVEIDPLDNEFQILAVTGVFNDGTLEKFISDGLEGKAKNASLVADEMGKMIRGTINNPNATVEERAVNREAALKHAEYIVKNYFDNPDEAKAFLGGINRFAENDVLREKGYIVIDNSDISPFKSYQSPSSNSSKWNEEVIKRFDDNEKNVADIIRKVKNSLNETDTANSLKRLLKAF